jgi:hypothetical protein
LEVIHDSRATGRPKEVRRIELAIYDDRGGVQAPARYDVQRWDGAAWRDVAGQAKTLEQPVGGQLNEVLFAKVKTAKVRIVFTHKSKARSGLSEIFIWGD